MMKDIEIKISRETRMVNLLKTTIGNNWSPSIYPQGWEEVVE